MRQCIYAEDYISFDFDMSKLAIRIRFTDDVYHKSLWENSEVNILLLMNYGYETQTGWHKDIPYFGHREGGYFLENAVERFNRENEFGITVKAEYQGRRNDGK